MKDVGMSNPKSMQQALSPFQLPFSEDTNAHVQLNSMWLD